MQKTTGCNNNLLLIIVLCSDVMLQEGSCSFYYRVAKKLGSQAQLVQHGMTTAWDMEDFVSLGKRVRVSGEGDCKSGAFFIHTLPLPLSLSLSISLPLSLSLSLSPQACPYFALRGIKEEAQIVFCPYNYLIDPLIREQVNTLSEETTPPTRCSCPSDADRAGGAGGGPGRGSQHGGLGQGGSLTHPHLIPAGGGDGRAPRNM